MTIHIAKLATEAGIFPLYEVENGDKYRLNRRGWKAESLNEYFSLQGRYRSLKEQDIDKAKERVAKEWDYLLRLAE
jgi:pyruvate/2-oxoacid:ferredoxin oxidoreductase beta subunit